MLPVNKLYVLLIIWLIAMPATGWCGAADSVFHFRQMGYDKIKGFVFRVERPDHHIDTIGLFSTNIKMPINDMKIMQWQILKKRSGKYFIPEALLDRSYTGISADDTELFLHPARDQYKILQFGPYPYFRNVKRIGDIWNWQLDIGGTWAIDSLYPVREKSVRFNTEYKLEDTIHMTTPFGHLPVSWISAITLSQFGAARAAYFLNNDYGLVYFSIECTNGQLFQFQLIDTIGEKEMTVLYPSLFLAPERLIPHGH